MVDGWLKLRISQFLGTEPAMPALVTTGSVKEREWIKRLQRVERSFEVALIEKHREIRTNGVRF